LFSVAGVVLKKTSQLAQRMAMYDKRLLRPGMAADVVVFDPAIVRDVATYEDPRRYSEGIEYVIINGKVVLDADKMTQERPGRFLKHRVEQPTSVAAPITSATGH